jgi:hypothetical protein
MTILKWLTSSARTGLPSRLLVLYIVGLIVSVSNMAWTAPDGQKSMIPRYEGLGIMISVFVSHEFGSGYYISPEDLKKVSMARESKHYSATKDAAKTD